ncbi:hypothetical protein AAG906_038019 [Vitis piasezkii]
MDEPPQLHFTAAPLLCKTLATQEPEGRRSHHKMKVIAAYLLAVLGGNTCPSAEDLKDILGSVGAEADDDRIELLLAEEKLASVPSGGGAAIAVAAPGGGGAAAPAAAEPKKEEKVEEKEESDDDMGFSLFD